jgi:hypothetical protein
MHGPLIQLSTRCASIDEFVEKFASFAAEGTLVLPAASELPVGTEGRFVIRLKDQSAAMRGRCRVLEVNERPPPRAGETVGAGRRSVMRVELLEMDDDSRAVHRRLLAHKRPPPPRRRRRPGRGEGP